MKKSIRFAVLALLLSGGFMAKAQDQRLQHILKEKMHQSNTNVPADQRTAAFKTMASGEYKITNSTNGIVEEAEGFIAINPADSNNMVLSFMEFSGMGLQFPIYYTTNGGQSWTKSNFNSSATYKSDLGDSSLIVAGGGDPVFAYDSDGKLYFSYIYLLMNQTSGLGYFVMYWATSLDKGVTWSFSTGNKRFVATGSLNLFSGAITNDYGDGIFDRQWHAVDRSGGTFDGRLYATGLFIPNDSTQLNGNGLVIKWKDRNDDAFDTVQTQLSATGNAQFGNVVVDDNGHVHVTFADLVNDNIYHRSSQDGGVTFGTPHLIFDGNSMFGSPTFNPYVHGRENAAPNLMVGADNILHLVWSDFQAGTTRGYYARSTDGGINWSTPYNLNALFSNQNTHNLMPVVGVNLAGNPSVSWFSMGSNKKALFYNAQSVDKGVSFLPPTVVSGDTTIFTNFGQSNFFGDYSASVRTACKTFVLWSDGRGIAPKMYVGTVDHCSSVGLPEFTPLGNGMQVMQLYPNPARNFVSVDLQSPKQYKAQIEWVNTLGQVCRQETVEVSEGKQQVKLHLDLPAGTYLLRITDGDGGTISRKVLVE